MRRLPTIAAARATKHIAKTSHIKDELIMATPSNPQTAQCNTNWDAVKVATPTRLDDCGPAMEQTKHLRSVASSRALGTASRPQNKWGRTRTCYSSRVGPKTAAWPQAQESMAKKIKRDALSGNLLRLAWGSLSMNTCDRNSTPGCHPLRPATERAPANQSGSFTPTWPTHRAPSNAHAREPAPSNSIAPHASPKFLLRLLFFCEAPQCQLQCTRAHLQALRQASRQMYATWACPWQHDLESTRGRPKERQQRKCVVRLRLLRQRRRHVAAMAKQGTASVGQATRSENNADANEARRYSALGQMPCTQRHTSGPHSQLKPGIRRLWQSSPDKAKARRITLTPSVPESWHHTAGQATL